MEPLIRRKVQDGDKRIHSKYSKISPAIGGTNLCFFRLRNKNRKPKL